MVSVFSTLGYSKHKRFKKYYIVLGFTWSTKLWIFFFNKNKMKLEIGGQQNFTLILNQSI